MSAAAHPGRRDRGALNYSTTRACDRVPSTGPAAAFFEWRPLNWLVDLMGGLAVLVLSWLLFPAAVTAIMSFFLERIATAVEALDYPGRGPPRRQRIGETIAATLRLTGLT